MRRQDDAAMEDTMWRGIGGVVAVMALILVLVWFL
jgi:flagellar biogenesis protein FliO